MIFGELSKEGIENLARNFGVFLDGVVTVKDYFWLNDRYETGGLTLGSVFGKDTAVFYDSVWGRG